MEIINLPEKVEFILNKLKEYGSIGYVVGGCIRDTFLGKVPKDFDIATPLLPEVVKKVFQDFQIIETGIKHGTVILIIGDDQYEITTFKNCRSYNDCIHSDNINFTDGLKYDLSRRDFTINSIAYNPDVGLIDFFNGLKDIEDGIIRCVGNPEDRFKEDSLRILRGLRFSITLGFKIENQTLYYMCEMYKHLNNVSKERVCNEICNMLKTQLPTAFKNLYNYIELFYYLTPYFDDKVKYAEKLFEHHIVIESLIATNSNDDIAVRLALLLQFSDNPKHIMEIIRFDNQTIKSVMHLLSYSNKYEDIKDNEIEIKYSTRKLMNDIGYSDAKKLCSFWNAKIISSVNINKFKYLRIVSTINNDIDEIVENDECYSLEKLDITGNDLIEIGFKEGIDIGNVLDVLLDEVLHDPYKNKKQWLIDWSLKIKNNTK